MINSRTSYIQRGRPSDLVRRTRKPVNAQTAVACRGQAVAASAAVAATEGQWTATGDERAVFVDESGRRRRFVLVGGALAGAMGTLWLCALVTGAIGFSSFPSLRVSPLLANSHPATLASAVDRDRGLAITTERSSGTHVRFAANRGAHGVSAHRTATE